MKKILITGATGFIGRHLCEHLIGLGYEVIGISRTPDAPGESTHPQLAGVRLIGWDDDFPETDVAIHLAGVLVDTARWSPKFIKQATDSRVQSARALKDKLTDSCKLVITASGANCYPFDGIVYDESGPYGDSISAEICRKWEGVWTHWPERFVAMRIGFVIGKGCAGLEKMLPIYKSGVGGVIGSGHQRMSWVAIDDLVRMFTWVIEHDESDGPINAVSPEPVSFKTFNAALAKATKRPAFWWIPGWVMRLMYGKMADELILADYPTDPKVLREGGFEWRTPMIDKAIEAAIS